MSKYIYLEYLFLYSTFPNFNTRMEEDMVLQTDNKTLDKPANTKRAPPAKWVKECAPEHELNSEVVLICGIEGCGRIYNNEENLRRHYRIHADRRYVCRYDGCGKKFMDSTKLRRHIHIHTGEKPCVCPHEGCGKRFALEYNLKIHSRTHKQESYHICPYENCGKRYAFDYKLQSHILARHEKHRNLDNSMKKKAQTFPFVCPYERCGKAYVYEYKLILHLRRCHPPLDNTEPDNDTDEGNQGIDVDGRKQSKHQKVSKIPSLKVTLRTGSSVAHADMNVMKEKCHGKDVHDAHMITAMKEPCQGKDVHDSREDSVIVEEPSDEDVDDWKKYIESGDDQERVDEE